jgi:hypothetical protein
LTPVQAVQVLRSSNDLSQIIGALEVTTLDPATRQVAIDYLDQPLDDVIITNYWLAHQAHKFSLSDEDRDQFLTPYWIAGKPRRLSPVNEAVIRDLQRYWAENSGAYLNFLNEHANPETFEVFKHFDQSIWGYMQFGINPTVQYTRNVKDNPALQKLYFDYLEEGMFDLQKVYSENAKRDRVALGVRNTRTGKFIHYQTADRLTDFMKAKPVREYTERFLADNVYPVLLGMHSGAADAELARIVTSDAYWANPDLQIGFAPLSIPDINRYEPVAIYLYQIMLSEPRYQEKDSLVNGLFGLHNIFAIQDYAPGRPHYASYNEPLDAADPSVYPQLLAFIADAEKLKLSPDSQKLLDDSKAKILALAAAHASAKP